MRRQIARALARLAWRIGGSPRRRAWKAGKTSTLMGGWKTYTQPIDTELRRYLGPLRARARLEAQNNDHVRHFLRLVKTNVVGANGVRMQARARLRNGRPDRRVNGTLEEAWEEWGRRGSCDVTGTMSWRDVQRAAVETVARDGEALVQRVRGWPENRFGYALRLLDVETLDVTKNETLGGGSRIVMGVELDGWRRPMAYHLVPEDTSAYSSYYRRRDTIRVPAEDILHLFLPEWTWQTRGVPWTATALMRLHNLDGYEEAEVVASRGSSAKGGFYELDADADPDYSGDGKDAQGNPVENVSPGEISILPPGWSFKGWDPQHPTTQFGDFVKSILRGVASGLGVNYNTLANDLEGVNYTSLRHGSLTERDVWMLLQDWLVEAFCRPVYEDWLEMALMSRALTTPGGMPYPMEREQDLRRVAFQPRRWQWVDPAKEIQAQRDAYNLRVTTLTKIMASQGLDAEEVFEEWASERELMAEYGVTPPAPSSPAPAAPPAADSPDMGGDNAQADE